MALVTAGYEGTVFMALVAEILKAKPVRAVRTVSADAPAFEAVRLLAEANVGALVVLDGQQVVGIVSERDCTRKLILLRRSVDDTQVHQIMSAPVLVVSPNRTGEECMALMTENRLRHLPVMNGAELVGMISIGDLVKQVVADQRFVIQQLEHYISGERA